MNYQCHYCNKNLERTSTVTLSCIGTGNYIIKCLNCFKTKIKFKDYNIFDVILVGNNYSCLKFSNSFDSNKSCIEVNSSEHLYLNKCLSYEDCILIFKKFNKISAFL